jgi:serine/threonine protein kinase/formylglycine-generating enzyme required for sulfatase activity
MPSSDLTSTRDPANQRVAEALFAEVPYQQLKEIGRGGMGVVFRAFQANLHRDVAMKLSLQNMTQNRQAFLSEARVTGSLAHPNIVPVYDLVSHEGKPCIVMKMMEGVSWRALLQPQTPENEALARSYNTERHLEILKSVCNAISFAHSRGIIHCDLKPDNVMIGAFGEVAVMDWGCAVDINAEKPGHTPLAKSPKEIESPFGTPCYMPPELGGGDGARINTWTDTFLLGGILHVILTGRPPHQGETLGDVLMAVFDCAPPTFDSNVPQALQDLCRRALSGPIEKRFKTAEDFQQALQGYFQTRKSLQLSEESARRLDESERAFQDVTQNQRNELYIDLSEAMTGFRNAQSLWPQNQEAKTNEARARKLLIQAALRGGDLGLAEAYAGRIPKEAPEAEKTQQEILRAKEERASAARQGKILRVGFVGAILAAGAVATIGYFSVRAEKQHTEEEARRTLQAKELASKRLEAIQRLSDVKILNSLIEEAEQLWPALPEKVSQMEQWLQSAQPVTTRLALHQETLEEMRSRAKKDASGAFTFSTHEEQWEHDTLAQLIEDIVQCKERRVPEMQRRIEFAKNLHKNTIEAYKAEWDATIAEIKASPLYGGLLLTPQLGLIPLGKDPTSGLFEFAHLASGAVPKRGTDGRLILPEDAGVVLVLIPAGTFTMGAQKGAAGDNQDPNTKSIEGPTHDVKLDAFFLGKYEFTQGQWLNAGGENPSTYQPNKGIAGAKVTLLHPVEQTQWKQSVDLLKRVGLTLPTEAQWEYSSRAGTRTVYWTGNSSRSLLGAANLADSYAKENGGPGSWLYEEFLNDGYVTHSPVGSFAPNAFGLHDTIGNVWEFCIDGYGSYTLPTEAGTGARKAEPNAPPLFRGGGFRSNTIHARSADRYGLYSLDFRGFDIGLRAARLIDK